MTEQRRLAVILVADVVGDPSVAVAVWANFRWWRRTRGGGHAC